MNIKHSNQNKIEENSLQQQESCESDYSETSLEQDIKQETIHFVINVIQKHYCFLTSNLNPCYQQQKQSFYQFFQQFLSTQAQTSNNLSQQRGLLSNFESYIQLNELLQYCLKQFFRSYEESVTRKVLTITYEVWKLYHFNFKLTLNISEVRVITTNIQFKLISEQKNILRISNHQLTHQYQKFITQMTSIVINLMEKIYFSPLDEKLNEGPNLLIQNESQQQGMQFESKYRNGIKLLKID